MTSILCSLQFWTNKEHLIGKDSDANIGCNFYHEKGETAGTDGYNEEKKNYLQSRGNYWSLSNRRPGKLKEKLKEFEELCSVHRCLRVRWKTNQIIQAVFGNGTIVYLSVNVLTGDVEKISYDRYLVGKLYSDHVVDVYQDDNNIIFSYVEPKLTCVQMCKKGLLADGNRKYEKLTASNPKVVHVDLSGPSGRRLTRRLVCNTKHDILMLWWRSAADEIWPWTPLSSDLERSNIQLYNNIAGAKFELVAYCRTELEPLIASLSNLHSNQVLTLEQKVLHTGEVIVERCIYEITLTKMERTAIVSIPLKSPMVCQEQNFQQDKILIGCSDGSLVMYDDQRRTSQTGKIPTSPSLISWHPKGCLVFVASKTSSIYCFDQALSAVKFQLIAEDFSLHNNIDLSDYFSSKDAQNRSAERIVTHVVWNSNAAVGLDTLPHVPTLDSAVVVMERGPFILLNVNYGIFTSGSFTSFELVAQYIKHQQIDEAINLLNNMNWNLNGDACFYVLTRIVNALFRLALTADREAQIETAIGTFYDPVRPLTKATILQYRDRIRNLARRFFHHLLRFNQLQKASLLAVDIGSVDLFKDLYYVAMEKGDHALAEVALRNVEGLNDSFGSETDTGESQDGDAVEEYSESSYSTDSSEAGNQQNHSVEEAKQSSHYARHVPLPQPSARKRDPLPGSAFKVSAKVATVGYPSHHDARLVKSPAAGSSFNFNDQTASSIRGVARADPIGMSSSNTDALLKNLAPRLNELDVSTTSARERSANYERRSKIPVQLKPYPDGEEKFVDSNPPSLAESDDENLGTVEVVHFGVV